MHSAICKLNINFAEVNQCVYIQLIDSLSITIPNKTLKRRNNLFTCILKVQHLIKSAVAQ